ncbi:MAG: type IV pilin protein [Planctomycetota bacterium]|jgi:general secretion pathway protein G
MKAKSGFTLVEILIVVVILGILAAIVIPQFTDASTQAKESSLLSDLQTMRSQIELYKIQHNDELPGTQGAFDFTQAMTTKTNALGTTNPADGIVKYGRYMREIPANPWNDLNTVLEAAVTPGAPSGNNGWFYNTSDGDIRSDDDVDPNHWDW